MDGLEEGGIPLWRVVFSLIVAGSTVFCRLKLPDGITLLFLADDGGPALYDKNKLGYARFMMHCIGLVQFVTLILREYPIFII